MERFNDEFDKKAYLKKFGEHLGKIRRSKGYSMDLLGDEAGLARGTISKIESGINDPKLSTLAKIAETLQISIEKLVKF